jgi:hypothetical protein
VPWDLSGEQVLLSPFDELALRILQDASSSNEWNSRTWLLRAAQEQYRDRADVKALSEAWGWLYAQGLVALDPYATGFNTRALPRDK